MRMTAMFVENESELINNHAKYKVLIVCLFNLVILL
jgi:hypothetical protein